MPSSSPSRTIWPTTGPSIKSQAKPERRIRPPAVRHNPGSIHGGHSLRRLKTARQTTSAIQTPTPASMTPAGQTKLSSTGLPFPRRPVRRTKPTAEPTRVDRGGNDDQPGPTPRSAHSDSIGPAPIARSHPPGPVQRYGNRTAAPLQHYQAHIERARSPSLMRVSLNLT